MKFSILLLLDDAQQLHKQLESEFILHTVQDPDTLLEQVKTTQSQLILMSGRDILNSKQKAYNRLKADNIYYDIPVVAYDADLDETEKSRLYTMCIKGILTASNDAEALIKQIYRVLSRSNPHVGTVRDRFVKAFLGYEDAYTLIADILYLTNYLIHHYQIDPYRASNIRLAVICLSIAQKRCKTHKVIQLLRNMDISPELIHLVEHYHKPASLDEKIILSALALTDQHNKMLLEEAEKLLDAQTLHVMKMSETYHKIVITCTHDIFLFSKRVNKVFEECPFALAVSAGYLLGLRNVLTLLLAKVGIMEAQIDTGDAQAYIITLKPEQAPQQTTVEALKREDPSARFCYDLDTANAAITLRMDRSTPQVVSENIRRQPTEISQAKEPPAAASQTGTLPGERQIDTSVINNMHYEDHHKITAARFLEEFEYDSYLIDDLTESENEAIDLLNYQESFNQKLLLSVIKTFEYYTRLLNETIEFRDLAYSLDALAQFLKTVDIDATASETTKMLKLHLMGIIDNLAQWKDHIFITKDSADIHYLDASLLNDCAQVESLFHARTSSDDDDNFELF